MKYYYHLSPENFSQFSPKFHKLFQDRGIFITNKKSMIHDWMNVVFSKKKSGKFKSIFIYKLHIPKNVIALCTNRNYEKINEQERSENFWFQFWGWGFQIFIYEEFLSQIKIVSKKRIYYYDFLDWWYYQGRKEWEVWLNRSKKNESNNCN